MICLNRHFKFRTNYITYLIQNSLVFQACAYGIDTEMRGGAVGWRLWATFFWLGNFRRKKESSFIVFFQSQYKKVILSDKNFAINVMI